MVLLEHGDHPGKKRRALADKQAFPVALAISPVFAISIKG
jgi:hypothetical protein